MQNHTRLVQLFRRWKSDQQLHVSDVQRPHGNDLHERVWTFGCWFCVGCHGSILNRVERRALVGNWEVSLQREHRHLQLDQGSVGKLHQLVCLQLCWEIFEPENFVPDAQRILLLEALSLRHRKVLSVFLFYLQILNHIFFQGIYRHFGLKTDHGSSSSRLKWSWLNPSSHNYFLTSRLTERFIRVYQNLKSRLKVQLWHINQTSAWL